MSEGSLYSKARLKKFEHVGGGRGGGRTGRGSIYRDGQRVPVLGGGARALYSTFREVGGSLYGQVHCIMGIADGHLGPLFLLPE